MSAHKKRLPSEMEQENRHLAQQMHQMTQEAKAQEAELKFLLQQKSALQIEMQQYQKEIEEMSLKLTEAREKEQVANQQSEDSEKRLDRILSDYKEKIQALEQDCSRFQIEISHLQASVKKKDSVISLKEEEVKVQSETIQHLELSLSRTKVDCGTRASNMESALVQSKRKCTALTREVDTISSEKMSLINGYEQLKCDLEKANSPVRTPTRAAISASCMDESVIVRKAASDTHLVSVTSSPSSTPVVGKLSMDRDISTVMSDYRRLQKDHQCLQVNFQHTASKLEQLKASLKQKEEEIACLQTVNCEYEDCIKELEKEQKSKSARILTAVAEPDSIKETLECKARIHTLETDLDDARKQYHSTNAALLEKQAVADRLTVQTSVYSEKIITLESTLQALQKEKESLEHLLKAKESESVREREATMEVQQLKEKLEVVTRDKLALEDLLEEADKDYEQLKAESAALKDAALDQKVKLREMQEHLEEQTTSHSHLAKDLELKEAAMLKLRKTVKELEVKAGVDKNRDSTWEQRVGSFQKAGEQAVGSFRHLLKETENFEKEKFELISILDEKNEALAHLYEVVDEMKEEIHSMCLLVQELEKVVDGNNKSYAKLKNAQGLLETENKCLSAQVSEMSAELQEKESRLLSSTKQIVTLGKDYGRLEKIMCDLQSECKDLELDKHQAEESVGQVKEALAVARDDYNRACHTLSSIRSDYIELQFAQKQLEEDNLALRSTVQVESDRSCRLSRELQHIKQKNDRLKCELNRQRTLLDQAKRAVLSVSSKKKSAMNECI